jgi:hypothetical protein
VFTVATPVVILVHVPPLAALARLVVAPAHRLSVPVIADAPELTVTTTALPQPTAGVYEMVVVPSTKPVTNPDALMVAFTVSLLLHTPPGVADANVVVVPLHTDKDPVMGATAACTVAT